MRTNYLKLLALVLTLTTAISSLAQVIVPANVAVSGPRTGTGGSLNGEYWKRPPVSIPGGGDTNPTNRIDALIKRFGPADGRFGATNLVYLGNDLTPVKTWLTNDASGFVGTTNNLDDGVFRFTGYINVAAAGNIMLGTTSDDGSRITIGGIDVINNDGSHGDQTRDTNVNFAAAGLYPIEVTYWNGDWTSDGTGANLNHSGNPDPSVHGGANFHLRVAGADVTAASRAIFYPAAQVIVVPGTLAVSPPATAPGGSLKGEYWKRPPVSIPTDGAANRAHGIDNLVKGFGAPSGTFTARQLVYLGNDLTPVTDWLTNDVSSFVGTTNNLDDGAFRFRGFINVTNAGLVNIGTTSDDGSRITIAGIDVINNDGSHGDATVDTNVSFAAAGLYPIEVTYWNGDWTSDGTGTNLNHSGSTDASVHGGANFHLRLGGADITSNGVARLYSTAPAVVVPANLAVTGPLSTSGAGLRGEYWKRAPVSIPGGGDTNPTNRIDTLIRGFGAPSGTFNATRLVYLGNDLTPVTTWLTNDVTSYSGSASNLDDGAFRFRGFINVTAPGNLTLGTTSDDGSRISIGGIDIINNDGSHGDQTRDTNVNFQAAGLYPIEVTYWNGDWTSDGTGTNLNHSGNPDPSVHGGANFHLRIGSNDVTAATATIFHPRAPSSMGLNFGADEYPTMVNAGTLTAAAVAGLSPQANWNNLRLNNGTNSGLVVDSSFGAGGTTASVTWSSPNTWSSTGRGEENNRFGTNTADRILMTGYLDSNNTTSGVVRVTVSGIPSAFTDGGYSVIVYALGGTAAARWGAYSIGTVTNILNSAASPTSFVFDPGLGTNDLGNYTVFTGLTSSSFTLIGNAVTDFGNGFRAPVSAVQIIGRNLPPQPPPELDFALVGTDLVISFPTGVRLQRGPTLTGPWTAVATNSPYMTPTTGISEFFRGISP